MTHARLDPTESPQLAYVMPTKLRKRFPDPAIKLYPVLKTKCGKRVGIIEFSNCPTCPICREAL